MKRKTSLTLTTPKKRRILFRTTGTVSLPQPVDFVCSRPVGEMRRPPARGSTKEPCVRCKTLLWIAPSTRKATEAPAICLDCVQKIAIEECV